MTETLEERLEYRIQSLQTYGVADQSWLILVGDLSDALAALRAKDVEIASRYLLTPAEKMLIDKLRAAGAAKPKPSPERPFFGDRPRRG